MNFYFGKSVVLQRWSEHLWARGVYVSATQFSNLVLPLLPEKPKDQFSSKDQRFSGILFNDFCTLHVPFPSLAVWFG